MKNRGFRERAGFALAGLRTGWRRERSFRTQCCFALLALAALVLLRPAPIWWAAVALSCGMVLTLELLNSAVEAIADLVQPDLHPEIKAIKDMLAGAVLLASGVSLAVGATMMVAVFAREFAR